MKEKAPYVAPDCEEIAIIHQEIIAASAQTIILMNALSPTEPFASNPFGSSTENAW